MLFSQILFLWNFSKLWKYIVRNSHYNSPFLFSRSRYINRATSFFISSQTVSLVHLRTRHKTVKNRHPDIMVPSNPPPKVLIHIMGLSLCKLSLISLNKSVSGSNFKWTFCILEIVACNWEIFKDRLLWMCPLKCLDNWSQVYALWCYLWGVTQNEEIFP